MNNKEIIKHCPNFYRIINFEFFEVDKLTEKLIGVYEKFIFSIDAYNPSDLLEITKQEKEDILYNNVCSAYIGFCRHDTP